jgi:hypothetical protein
MGERDKRSRYQLYHTVERAYANCRNIVPFARWRRSYQAGVEDASDHRKRDHDV